MSKTPMKRINPLRSAVLVLAAACLWSCSAGYIVGVQRECQTDSECPSGSVCLDNFCSEGPFTDDAGPPRQIQVLSGEKDHCQVGRVEGQVCDARATSFWWCTDRDTCDIWGCAPVDQGGTWRHLDSAPPGGCNQGCPNDFDAAVKTMDYCAGMVCRETVGNTCRELRCLGLLDYYELETVECSDG